ncbi:MAG: dipeptidase, partial [Pseudomonadota bacterium]
SNVPQGIESTRSATAIYKRLMYLILQHSDDFLDQTAELWRAMESQWQREMVDVLASAAILLRADESKLAAQQLTRFSNTELYRALDAAEKLAAAYEVQTRARYGVSNEPVARAMPQKW